MSDPRKYGLVCQLAVRNSRKFSARPAAAAQRVASPSSTSSPMAISTKATVTPANAGWWSGKARSRNPPGVWLANPCSWSPM